MLPATTTSDGRSCVPRPLPDRNVSSRHAPVARPSAIARTSPASISSPATNAAFRAPKSRTTRAAAAPAACQAPRSGFLPTPVRRSRGAAMSPRVCTTRTWPTSPVTSPSLMMADTSPPSAASTAASAPAGVPGGSGTGSTSTSARIRAGSAVRLLVTCIGPRLFGRGAYADSTPDPGDGAYPAGHGSQSPTSWPPSSEPPPPSVRAAAEDKSPPRRRARPPTPPRTRPRPS